jgi:ATP-binding cassette, subfamily B, multidrug efflux pump
MRSQYIRILRYLKPYTLISILAPAFLIVEVIVTLLIPDTMSKLIDIGIENENLKLVWYYGGLMLAYSFLGIFFAFLSNFFSTWASAAMVNDIRIETFSKALKMSFKSLDELETGKVITRVTSDVNSLRWVTKAMLRVLIKAPVTLIGALVMAFRISPKLSIIFGIMVPILFIATSIIVKKSYPLFRSMQQKLENINNMTHENLENIRVVKAFNRGDHANDVFDEKIEDLKGTTIKANIITSFTNPISLIIINLSTAAILYFGGLDVVNNELLVGDIVAFIQYLGLIAGSLSMMTGIINLFPRAEASSARVLDLIESNLELMNAPKIKDIPFKGQIEFQNVSFDYPDGTEVLRQVSFKVEPGKRLGIIGTTGSGKTTLTNLIARFYDATEGQILIDGEPIQDYDLHFLRSQISMVMQKALLFSGTIGDNIKFGNMAAPEEAVIEASTNTDALEFIQKYPEQFDSIIGQRGINLSGGQKQRVSMARSLIIKPRILIFDDSTSAVDMTTEARILSSLRKNIKDTTLIIIAQRIQSIIDADQILVLENGHVTGYGTHEDLLASNAFYQEIYEAQVGSDTHEE